MKHKLKNDTGINFNDFIKQCINEEIEKIIRNEKKSKCKKVQTFLNSLNENQRNNLIINYSGIRKYFKPSNPLTFDLTSNKSLEEGLIRTYPIDKTISYIKSYFGLYDSQIEIIEDLNNVRSIGIFIPNSKENIEIVEKAFLFCGYYLANPKKENIPNETWIYLKFNPKYIKEEDDSIRNECNFLFHITPFYHIDKIMHIGLSPRSTNNLTNYPGRVYLIKDSASYIEIINLAKQLNNENKNPMNNGRYVILKLDVSKIPNNVKLYLDGDYKYGVYTPSNIPPTAILSKKEIQL